MGKDSPPATKRETEVTIKSAILPLSAVSVNISNSSESNSRNVMVKCTITLPFLQRLKRNAMYSKEEIAMYLKIATLDFSLK